MAKHWEISVNLTNKFTFSYNWFFEQIYMQHFLRTFFIHTKNPNEDDETKSQHSKKNKEFAYFGGNLLDL